DRAGRVRLYGCVEGGQVAGGCGAAGEFEGAGALYGGVRVAGGVSGACVAGDGAREQRQRRQAQSDDAACSEGARVRDGVSAGLGRGIVSVAADDGREGQCRARGGAAAGLCRTDAREEADLCFVCRESARAWAVAERAAVALYRRAARGAYRQRGE